MSFAKLLNKLCTIQTKTESQNDTGSVTTSWADTYVSIPVRYNRASGKGGVNNGSLQVTLEDYTFYFKPDVTISIADRIVVDGKTFEVEHVYMVSNNHHLEVMGKLRDFN